MKMTDADERALAVMQFARGYLTWNNMQEFDDALQHLRARLAAGQQKGGGVAFGWWCATGRGGFIRNDGTEDACEHCTPLYVTPQPSIPAPAQQDGKASGGEYLFTSEEVDEAIELLRFHRSSIVTEAIDHMEACLRANVDDALAHPPHADQETQG